MKTLKIKDRSYIIKTGNHITVAVRKSLTDTNPNPENAIHNSIKVALGVKALEDIKKLKLSAEDYSNIICLIVSGVTGMEITTAKELLYDRYVGLLKDYYKLKSECKTKIAEVYMHKVIKNSIKKKKAENGK